MGDETVKKLRADVVDELKRRFRRPRRVSSTLSRPGGRGRSEHLFLFMAHRARQKSALIRQFASAVPGSLFRAIPADPVLRAQRDLLARSTWPGSREGAVATVTTGMLPEGRIRLPATSSSTPTAAILNNLLTVLNERVLPTRGRGPTRLALAFPVLGLGTTWPRTDGNPSAALFDRFLLRCRVDHLKPRSECPAHCSRPAGPLAAVEQAGRPTSVSAADLRT